MSVCSCMTRLNSVDCSSLLYRITGGREPRWPFAPKCCWFKNTHHHSHDSLSESNVYCSPKKNITSLWVYTEKGLMGKVDPFPVRQVWNNKICFSAVRASKSHPHHPNVNQNPPICNQKIKPKQTEAARLMPRAAAVHSSSFNALPELVKFVHIDWIYSLVPSLVLHRSIM